MASVYFDPAVGGDGSTVTDDTNPTTGLANGGHRARFVPSLAQAVAVAANTVTKATQAAASASAAAASATTALNAPGTTATSTTSTTIGTGSKSLTIQTGKTIVVGMQVMIADTANPATNFMRGTVTSYTSGTGALVVNVDYTLGSGTIANWTISLTGAMDTTRAPLNSPAFTGNPTAPTPAAGDNDTSVATTAFVQNAVKNGAGTGGTTITGNVTLTATSAAAMSVTPSAPGLYATLPDATTLNKQTTLFSIYNAGDYDYGLKNSAGTVLGWVRPRTGAVIGLSDSSTSAGVWAYYGLEKIGVTAAYINSTIANMTGGAGGFKSAIAIDANRTCFVFGSTDCYAIVYDASTQTWGSATLVRASITASAYMAILSAANQVLVVSAITTAMEAVTLSISGTTITVNTANKGTATLAGNISNIERLIAVGSSWVVAYQRTTTTQGIRAISVSVNTPTIGSETSLNGAVTIGRPYWLFASGSIVRTIYELSTGATFGITPYTVSGSTLSAGTGTSVSATDTTIGRAFLNGNGNIVFQYLNTTVTMSVIKLTGTTEAASSVSMGATPSPAVISMFDYVSISAGKTLSISGSTGTWSANILTDTAGTASAGTALTGSHSSIGGVQGLAVSGNAARLGLYASGAAQTQCTLDCSGASPTLTSVQTMVYSSSFGPTAFFGSSDKDGVRSASTLIAGANVYRIRGDSVGELLATPSGVRKLAPITMNVGAANGGQVGASASESWIGNVVNSSTGYIINRVEAAA